MPKPQPWLRREATLSKFAELATRYLEERKKLVACLVPGEYLEAVRSILQGLETQILENRVLGSIRYIFDDSFLEVTPSHILLQFLGRIYPTAITDLSSADTITSFLNHLRSRTADSVKSRE